MPAYEAGEFEPPAPIIRAIVRGPGNAICPDVPLLIDTGADVSVVPLDVAKAVGAAIGLSSVPIEGYGGSEITCSQADLSVEFLQYSFRGVFLLADLDCGIVGRNILNSLVVTLDGPRLSWSLGVLGRR